MLFDLRSPGRRRVVQATYLFLAILIGGGLILVGFGGGGGGGLLDALQGEGSGDNPIQKKADKLEEQVAKNPKNEQAWAQLTRARYQLAFQDYNQQTNQFNKEGLKKLNEAAAAWNQYLALKPKNPDPDVAKLITRAFDFPFLNQPEKGVKSQEIVVEDQPNAANYAQLAYFYYLNSNTRLGDVAAAKAVSLAPKTQRKALKEQLKQAAQIPQLLLQQKFQNEQPKNLPFEGGTPFGGGLSSGGGIGG